MICKFIAERQRDISILWWKLAFLPNTKLVRKIIISIMHSLIYSTMLAHDRRNDMDKKHQNLSMSGRTCYKKCVFCNTFCITWTENATFLSTLLPSWVEKRYFGYTFIAMCHKRCRFLCMMVMTCTQKYFCVCSFRQEGQS